MANAERPIVACVGAGRMGRGIAHCFAYAGYQVRLLDAKMRQPDELAAFFAETSSEVRASLEMMAGLGAFDARAIDRIMARVSLFSEDQAARALAGARYVFEAVPETKDAKRAALALIDRAADDEAIIASTTSTFLSTELSELSDRPGRFLNAHWLNPAFLVPLVELSPTQETDRSVVEEVKTLMAAIGKVPVECAASPGYIVPRIQALAMNEAARLVEEGVASAEDIDKAVKYGFGFRFAVLGLLEFIDWGGGDILYYASRYLAGAMNDKRFDAPPVIHANMVEGRNGLRDGRGFYDYAARDIPAYRRSRFAELFRQLQQAGLAAPPADSGPSAIDSAEPARSVADDPPEPPPSEPLAAAAPADSNTPFEVEIESTGQVVTVGADQSIIDALEAAGVDLIYDCRRGECGICQTAVIEGVPDHRDVVLSDEEKASNRLMQICVSRSKSPRLVLEL
jgi:3-hydroxybutyryl-CoA dehydrogenase